MLTGVSRPCVPLTALVVALFSPAPVLDAEGTPQRGVAFVSQEPFKLEGAEGASLEAEVFNGSPQRQTLRLAVGGDAKAHVSVTPKEERAGAGGIVGFTVKLDRPPGKNVAGELRAFSSDGTLARAAIAVGKARPEAPAEAAAGYPRSLDFGVLETGKVGSLPVANLPGDVEKPVQVGHVSGEGRAVPVLREGDKLTVSPLAEPGAYSGAVDLAPGEEGGDVAVSADVRDPVWWATLLLAVGLVVAVISESFLRRWRPEWVLKRRLRELGRLTARRQDQAVAEVKALRPTTPERRGWGIPRIYEPETPTSLFVARGDQITESLKNAASDAQRDRWGPDGDEVKELEDETESYGKLLDTLVALARDRTAFGESAKPEDRASIEGSPLLEFLDQRLSDRILGPGSLDREMRATEALTGPLASLTALYARFVRLERDARTEGDDDAAAHAAAKRYELVRSTWDGDDAKSLAEDARTLGKKIYGRREDEAGEPADEHKPLRQSVGVAAYDTENAHSSPAPLRPCQRSSAADLPAEPLAAVPRRAGAQGWAERNFSLADGAFILLTLVIVLLSGLTVLYYGDDTFGSTGDEIGALVWGSTATAGIALARRLVPGTFKNLGGS